MCPATSLPPHKLGKIQYRKKFILLGDCYFLNIVQIALMRLNSLRSPRTQVVDDKDLLGYTSEIQFVQNLKARCGRQGAGSILYLQFT